ncbi:MAG: hypothetical protein M0023_00505 [Desulfobacteraceae bacterium]|nr:hypothetical protein [Desulfobacteraceae bacterium]
MFELSTDAKMIIASNLTIAAAIRDAAMAMKSGPQPTNSVDMVAEMFATIISNLEKQFRVTP